ncbi:MAG: hypothetical protein ACOYJK_09715 [Prevotella sp.]
MEVIRAKRVTRDMVRAIEPGRSVCFCLPDGKACECARSVISQIKAIERVDLSATVNYADSLITITRR